MKSTLSLIASCILSGTLAQAQSPIGLVATTATSKKVDLSWTDVGSTYTVQRAPLGGSFSTIATVTVGTLSDTQFDPYTVYQYQVLVPGNANPSNRITVGPPPAGFSNAAPAPGPIGNQVPGYGFNLSMVLDGNGDPAFAFVFDDPNQDTDHSDSQLLFRSWNRAKYIWNPTVTIATVGDIAQSERTGVSLAFDPNTSAFAVACEVSASASINVYSSTNGLSWPLKTTIRPAGGDATGPSLMLAGGNVYLSYTVTSTGLNYVTGQLAANATTWVSKVAPTPNGTGIASSAYSASLALDSANNPAVAYWAPDSTDPNGYNSILLFWRPNPGTTVKITDTQKNQGLLAARLRFFGLQPRILFYAQRNDAGSGVAVHFVRSEDGGNTWMTPVVIPPDGNSSTDYPFDMALDSQGHGAAAFGRNSSTGDSVCGNPKLSLSTDLTKWTTCAAADVSLTGDFQVFPSAMQLLYGGNDKLYLMWTDEGTGTTSAGILIWRQPPACAAAGPFIFNDGTGVINGGSYLSGNVVSGSWVAIKGTGFTDKTMDWSNSDFSNNTLPTSLNGVQVLFNGVPGAVWYLITGPPQQINVQAPANLNGNVSVQVVRNGVASNTVATTAVQAAPGIFSYTLDAGTTFYPAAVFLDRALLGDPAVLSNTRKAKAGDTVILFANSLAPSVAGAVNVSGGTHAVTVTIGPTTFPATFSGLVAPGEFQINIIVPPGLPDGNNPITIHIDGQTSQSGVVFPTTH